MDYERFDREAIVYRVGCDSPSGTRFFLTPEGLYTDKLARACTYLDASIATQFANAENDNPNAFHAGTGWRVMRSVLNGDLF